MSALQKTIALRAEFWNNVLNTDAYKAFSALDDAVAAQGGARANRVVFLAVAAIPAIGFANPRPSATSTQRRTKRITQSQIAERVLQQNGEPLPVGRWLEKCITDALTLRVTIPYLISVRRYPAISGSITLSETGCISGGSRVLNCLKNGKRRKSLIWSTNLPPILFPTRKEVRQMPRPPN